MSIKIFADGADLVEIEELAADPRISGFTTNPTLMRKAGVENYEMFCRGALELIGGKPISFEVFSDEHQEMYEQALRLSSLGDNVYVKIPVTNTKGQCTMDVVLALGRADVKVNVTAVFTLGQVKRVCETLTYFDTPAIVSVFAGRIADTGLDPLPHMVACLSLVEDSGSELLWASPRQVGDIRQAEAINCDIITVTKSLLDKMVLFDKDLDEYSRETVQMFYDDAQASGYTI